MLESPWPGLVLSILSVGGTTGASHARKSEYPQEYGKMWASLSDGRKAEEIPPEFLPCPVTTQGGRKASKVGPSSGA